MTFLEVLLLIQNRSEKILTQEVRFLITNQHRYLRGLEGDSPWREDTEPGAPEQAWGRGGSYYIWKRQELPPT